MYLTEEKKSFKSFRNTLKHQVCNLIINHLWNLKFLPEVQIWFSLIVQKNWLIIPHHVKKKISHTMANSTSHEVQRFNQVQNPVQASLTWNKLFPFLRQGCSTLACIHSIHHNTELQEVIYCTCNSLWHMVIFIVLNKEI